jgi:hypothetical protein
MRLWPSSVYEWGSTAAERAQPFPCDPLVPSPDETLYRALDVYADSTILFRWLCQLRAAPYSYDWLDNRGRRSPQRLTPGLEKLEIGQRAMSIFRITSFEQDRSITLLSHGPIFGRVACTYRVRADGQGRSRLVVKLLVAYPDRAVLGHPMRVLLPFGDLVMMRRQLLNLRALAAAVR